MNSTLKHDCPAAADLQFRKLQESTVFAGVLQECHVRPQAVEWNRFLWNAEEPFLSIAICEKKVGLFCHRNAQSVHDQCDANLVFFGIIPATKRKSHE